MNPRELKFRVWSYSSKKFLSNYQGEKFCELISLDLSLYQGICDFKNENYQIQQFTGLRDSAGADIYEGDILKFTGKSHLHYALPGAVSLGEYFTHAKQFPHFGFRIKRIDMENAFFGLNAKRSRIYKIIGNIFENPELLKNNESF